MMEFSLFEKFKIFFEMRLQTAISYTKETNPA